MKLLLRRDIFTTKSTTGQLFVDGQFECYTLEDRMREKKVHGQTAIPMGRYNVIVNHSRRFGKDMPLLENVSGFSGIRIHSGNTAGDTEGCILVGNGRTVDRISDSRTAFKALFAKIKAALDKKETVSIEIVVELPAEHISNAAVVTV